MKILVVFLIVILLVALLYAQCYKAEDVPITKLENNSYVSNPDNLLSAAAVTAN